MLAYVVAVWLLSLPLHDVSIVDAAWGGGFVIVGWIAFAAGDGCRGRRLLLAARVTVWGLRLAAYLTVRRSVPGTEDPGTENWRERHGARFPLVSLVNGFLLQGALISGWFRYRCRRPRPGRTRSGRSTGSVRACGRSGLLFEALGDAQLARFKADPANRGTVMDGGYGATHDTRTTSATSSSGGAST